MPCSSIKALNGASAAPMPENNIALALLEELNEPLMSTTLILPDEELPMVDPEEMRDRLGNDVDLIIDGGHCGDIPTTVVDLTEDVPEVLRQGRGDVSVFE